MNHFNRIRLAAAAVSSGAVLLSAGCGSAKAPAEFPVYSQRPQLSVNSQLLIEKMLNLQVSLNYDTIPIEGTVSAEDVDMAMNTLIYDTPEAFWLSPSFDPAADVRSTGTSTVISANKIPGYTGIELTDMYYELNDAANEVAKLAEQYDSDLDRIHFVHDYIIEHTEYAESAAGHPDISPLAYSAYGALVQGSAVSKGYALAFDMVLDKLGIDCGCCHGQLTEGLPESSHYWSYVQLNGSWYWTDTAWDDYHRDHRFFMVNTDVLSRTRSVTDDGLFIPECTSLDASFYMESYDADKARELLAANTIDSQKELIFTSNSEFKKAKKDMKTLKNDGTVSDFTADSDELVIKTE